MTELHLTVAIATMIDRVADLDISALPVMDSVSYQIFVQGSGGTFDIPARITRSDIQVFHQDSYGVTNSRNAAIESATGDVLLFADDDVTSNTDSYASLRKLFLDAPYLDFACGQLHGVNGKPFKTYPDHLTPATRLNTAKVGTPELAIRARSIRDKGIRFDTTFGAGSLLWLGDEYIFLCDALRAGLRGYHINLVLGTHPHQSTGHQNSALSFEIREKVFRRAFGPVSWPFRFAFAAKNRKRFPSLRSLWRFIRP